MTEVVDKKPNGTRLEIINAAASEFAVKPYSAVSLDGILAHADVTKGALYTHFRSKTALAKAIVQHRAGLAHAAFDEISSPTSAAIESLIDDSYLIATADIGDELARAALNLLESVGRFDGFQRRILGRWAEGYAQLIQRGIDEGDVLDTCDPAAAGRLLVGMYLGLRQTSDLNDPKEMIGDVESAWLHVLPGLAVPERLGYLTGFIQRRSALAVRNTAPLVGGTL